MPRSRRVCHLFESSDSGKGAPAHKIRRAAGAVVEVGDDSDNDGISSSNDGGEGGLVSSDRESTAGRSRSGSRYIRQHFEGFPVSHVRTAQGVSEDYRSGLVVGYPILNAAVDTDPRRVYFRLKHLRNVAPASRTHFFVAWDLDSYIVHDSLQLVSVLEDLLDWVAARGVLARCTVYASMKRHIVDDAAREWMSEHVVTYVELLEPCRSPGSEDASDDLRPESDLKARDAYCQASKACSIQLTLQVSKWAFESATNALQNQMGSLLLLSMDAELSYTIRLIRLKAHVQTMLVKDRESNVRVFPPSLLNAAGDGSFCVLWLEEDISESLASGRTAAPLSSQRGPNRGPIPQPPPGTRPNVSESAITTASASVSVSAETSPMMTLSADQETVLQTISKMPSKRATLSQLALTCKTRMCRVTEVLQSLAAIGVVKYSDDEVVNPVVYLEGALADSLLAQQVRRPIRHITATKPNNRAEKDKRNVSRVLSDPHWEDMTLRNRQLNCALHSTFEELGEDSSSLDPELKRNGVRRPIDLFADDTSSSEDAKP
eukprot:ANDGO_00097.mRNA.1 hypothetical protein